jgi:xanthine dehydrogenase YagR molybdenum-binding subunit
MGILGQPLDRVDGHLKVTGGAHYAAEFPTANVAHAALVGSSVAAGQITGFDLARAQAMPGVLAILTPDNAPRLTLENAAPQTVTAPLMQDHTVLFNRQPVALVVADSLERALAAAGAVRVQYHETEALTAMEPHLAQAYVPKDFRNGDRPPDTQRGTAEAAFNNAAIKVDVTYMTPIEHHNPMEPHATIAAWDGDHLTVWTATQGIAGAHVTLATFFGLDPKNVRIICPYVGGGFGSKGNTWPPVTLTAMAARLVGRPVKLVLERADMYANNGYRPQTIQRLRLGAGADGKLVSLRHDGITSMSMPQLGEFAEPTGLAAEMLYACPNVAVTHRLVSINAGLPTYMRAPGEASGVFALESAMDELAVATKLDPLELRLRNYTDQDPHENKPFASKALRACYSQGADAFGWSRRTPEPGSMRDGATLIGWGMATATYPTNRMAASARVRMGANGGVLVQSATQDLGTGTYTVLAQLAADELGVPMHRVQVEIGDSTMPLAPVSGGSMTVASMTPAVQQACAALRGQLVDLALSDPVLGWKGQDRAALKWRDGAVVGPGGQVRLAELLAHHGQDAIEVTADAKPGDERDKYSMHAFGAQFVELRIDPELGMIRVARYVGAFDGGRIMNRKTARSQLIGGITFGIGMALFEQTRMDRATGRITNANLSDYLVAVNADVPDLQTILVANDELVSNPLGAKGLGELPMVGVAAAIANAVWHATGKRVRKVPIRIEDVMA